MTEWEALGFSRDDTYSTLDFEEALIEAIKNYHAEAADELLRRVCHISPDVILAAAVAFEESDCDTRIWDVLLENGLDLNQEVGSFVGMILLLPIRINCYWGVEYLLEKGADPNLKGMENELALELARSEAPELVELLVSYGARDDSDEENDPSSEF